MRAGGLEGNVFPGTGKGIEVAERADEWSAHAGDEFEGFDRHG